MRALLMGVLVVACGVADAALVGNGRLTAGVDEFGCVAVCRWPGPGMNNQAGPHGVGWALKTRDGLATFDEKGWQASPWEPAGPGIHAVRLNGKGGFASATCETLVVPGKDVLVSRFTLLGAEDSAKLVWTPDLSPRAAIVPELGGLQWLVPQNGLKPFFHRQAGLFYLFSSVGGLSGDWRSVNELEGVWIVCGGRGGDFNDSFTAPAFAFGTSQGQTNSAIVYVAFGKTKAEADAAFQYASSASFEQLRGEVIAHGSSYGGPGASDLATLIMSIDPQTGAFCRDAGAIGAEALCYARDAAWASLALDLAGRPEDAERVLTFAVSTMRKEQRRSKPRGSLPIACYGDGTEALPHLALDADAPAYVLGGLWRHAAAMGDAERRRQFLSGMWESVSLMAGFLSGWTDGRNREPLHSFDLQTWRDVQGPERLLTTYMGMDAALRIADALGQAEPEEWARRKVELDALIRFQLIARETGAWKAGPILPFWHGPMAEDWTKRGYTLPSWDSPVEQMLKTPTSESAATAALVWRDDPKRAAHQPPNLPSSNGLEAAQRLIASLY